MAYKQAMLLVICVLAAVIAMGSLSAWNLRNGFSDYLAARDIDRLEQFAELVSEVAEVQERLQTRVMEIDLEVNEDPFQYWRKYDAMKKR